MGSVALEYDPTRPPASAAWLAAGEEDRLRAVVASHRAREAPHPPMPSERVHAAMHVVVETQVAAGSPPETSTALARLIAAGLSRHEAIHAIAAVVSDAMARVMRERRVFDRNAFARALDAIDADPWRGSAP